MPFEKGSKRFLHLQYIPVIQRMYDKNNLDEMKEYASFSQVERFRRELDTLRDFGLHKQLEITLDKSRIDQTAAITMNDGKVDSLSSVSSAKIKETYRDRQNKKRYRRKIRHAFIESTLIKSNKNLSYNDQNPPHCMNCGSPMKVESENYFCPYCRTRYQAEAYKYLMTRFFIEEALRELRFFLVIFIPAIIIGILLAAGVLTEEQAESINLVVAFIIAIPFTALFLFTLNKGLLNYFRHLSIKRKIRRHDPNFSEEIFTMRLNDLLAMHPEVLMADQKEGNVPCGVICRNVLHLEFRGYKRRKDLEIIECFGKIDALYLKGEADHVKLKDRHKKITLRMARVYGTLTPVHYQPDQFTCRNCGSHQAIRHAGMQVCSFCRTENPMESIDWVLA